jgi:hypothetical protein
MVSSPDNANVPDLGSILTDLDTLSTDDANDFLGLRGHLINRFLRGWSS